MSQIEECGKTFLLAKSEFNRAYYLYWHKIEPCDDVIGFRILGHFRRHVEKFSINLRRGSLGVKHAAQETYRLVITDDTDDYTWDEAFAFAKWYARLKGKISEAIANLFEFEGDSFGDLCDSLPLAGEGVVQAALATHPKSEKPRRDGFLDEEEIYKAVKAACSPAMAKFITSGENYIGAALEQAAKHWWLHRVLTGRDGTVWTEAEQKSVQFACFDDE